MKKFLLLFVLTVLSTSFFSQEICNNGIDDDANGLIDLNDPTCNCAPIPIPSLIPNPSFENMNCCPSSFSQVNCAANWNQATNATSDYFNCGYNFGAAVGAGLAPPPNGTGYLGAIFSPGWQEYVGACLLTPMLAGTSYTLNFQIASTPITGWGDVCNGGVVNFGPIDITLYGLATCPSFPIGTTGCPPGWTVLGTATYTPVNNWGIISITFVPTFNVNAVIIGSPCTLPGDYNNPGGCYPYFYFDDLILNQTGFTTGVTQTGSWCTNDIQLIGVSTTGATYQWFLNGIALVGETNLTLNVSANNYGVGEYTIVTYNGATCSSASDSVLVPPVPVSNFTSNPGCLNDSVSFVDQSTIPTGSITNWSWDFGDGPGTSTSQNPTYTYTSPGTYTVTLITTSNDGCSDTTTQTITINPLPTSDFDFVINGNSSAFGLLGGCLNTTDTIFFTNNSAVAAPDNITAYLWDFDDGSTSTLQNPTHAYTSAGTYNVQLIVETNNGCSDTSEVPIIIYPAPIADFSLSNVCFGTTVSFTDQSLGNGGTINQWNWDFTNDGTVDNTNQNPSYGYTSAGTYTAELLVETTDGCKDSINKMVVVHPLPVANFSATNVCLNTTTQFTDSSNVATGSITNWSWDFGDGVGTSTQTSPSYLYTTSGTFNVSLTVTTDSGCTDNVIIPITVYPNPTAAFTTNDVCQNVAAQFNSTTSTGNGGTINQWDWDFDFISPTHTTDAIIQNPNNNYSSSGNYTVQLIVTSTDGCSDTVANPITIHSVPNADFTFNNECYGTAISFNDNSNVTSGTISNWNWDFGNTNTSTNQNPSELYASDGQYNVTLTVTSNNGCQDSITKTITVYPLPNVDFTPTEVCLNDVTQFTDLSTINTGSNVGWNWDFNDGSVTNNQQNPSHIYALEGLYQVQLIVTTNYGCQDSIIKPVTVNPLPQVNFVADVTEGCSPVVVNFTDNSTINPPGANVNWFWDFGDAGTSMLQNPSGIAFTNPSNSSVAMFDVSLTVTSDKGCSITTAINNMISSYPIPLASFTYDPLSTTIYESEINFTDNSIIASQWLWDLGDGASSTIQNPTHLYADSGEYQVILYIENVYGCKDTTQKFVKIDPVFVLFIPNAFTPDNDGTNDFFFANGYGYTQIETLIFNRWGELIFEGYELDSKWDGVYKGDLAKNDVYVYRIKVRDVFGEWHEYTGKVSLIR